MENKTKFFMPSYEAFINEQSYDEQDTPPNSSFRSEDYKAKDDLRLTCSIIDEILNVIGDGEELDQPQIEIIEDIYSNIQRLKRSIEGREEIKGKEEEKREKEQSGE